MSHAPPLCSCGIPTVICNYIKGCVTAHVPSSSCSCSQGDELDSSLRCCDFYSERPPIRNNHTGQQLIMTHKIHTTGQTTTRGLSPATHSHTHWVSLSYSCNMIQTLSRGLVWQTMKKRSDPLLGMHTQTHKESLPSVKTVSAGQLPLISTLQVRVTDQRSSYIDYRVNT